MAAPRWPGRDGRAEMAAPGLPDRANPPALPPCKILRHSINWPQEDASPVDGESFAFESFRLIPAQRMLRYNGELRRLGSRAPDILIAFVERAPSTLLLWQPPGRVGLRSAQKAER
jgi:hypothetical protein